MASMASSYLISSSELHNIPISSSILHDKEYKNLCTLYELNIKKNTRRAFSEKNEDIDTCTPKTPKTPYNIKMPKIQKISKISLISRSIIY
jgi:hypothetical protein